MAMVTARTTGVLQAILVEEGDRVEAGQALARLEDDEQRIAFQRAKTSRDNNFGAVASILADRVMLTSPRMRTEQGWRSTGIPGWVTQADVLQVIGPSIAARSDTFRIRTMGEARDGSGNVIATAYCEAIVQRQPDYVDASSNQTHERGGALTDTNQTYGRKFEIVSFRWLSPNEI